MCYMIVKTTLAEVKRKEYYSKKGPLAEAHMKDRVNVHLRYYTTMRYEEATWEGFALCATLTIVSYFHLILEIGRKKMGLV